MNRAAEIVIVGGGILGLTIARRLAQDNQGVVLFDRGLCGREASWAGAGVLAPANPHRKDAAAALLLRSLALYPALCDDLLAETGIDPEYDPCGEIELAFDEPGLRSLRDDVEAARGRAAFGPDLQQDSKAAFALLTREQALRLEPAAAPQLIGAMHCRETAQVRNPRLLRALHESCLRRGVDIRESTPISDLIESEGRVTGVQFGPAGGEMLRAGWVILCAGAWSSQITSRLASVMPVHPVRGQMILMKLDRRPFGHIIARGKTYLVPRRDGHVLLGATEEHDSGYSKRNTPRGVADLISRGIRLVPSLADAPILTTWAGLRPGTADDLPYIGSVPDHDRLLAATGHFRTGLSSAPATAEVIAAAIAGRSYDLDLTCCRPGRT